MDAQPSDRSTLLPEACGASYRHRKSQLQDQFLSSNHEHCEDKDLIALPTPSVEKVRLSPVLPASVSEKAAMNNNNNHNNIYDNNNGHKNSMTYLPSVTSSDSLFGSDVPTSGTVGLKDHVMKSTPSPTSPPPLNPMSSSKNKRHWRTSSSAHTHDCKKRRSTGQSSLSSNNGNDIAPAQQTSLEDVKSTDAQDSDGEDDNNIDDAKKIKHLTVSLPSRASPSSCHQDTTEELDMVGVGSQNHEQNITDCQHGHNVRNSSRLQADSRPSAIVKVKTELPSPPQGCYNINDDGHNDNSSTTSGPDSSISEGRGMSMTSPSSCPISSETSKTIFSASPGVSPRHVRSPSPIGQNRQPHFNQQRQLQHVHQPFNPLNGQNYPYPHHFLGQAYSSHKIFPQPYANNHHHIPPQLIHQQHHDLLSTRRRAASTSSSSPSSSSSPPSPDLHHHLHHPQSHPDPHLPPLTTTTTTTTTVRPQQLSPKASNFSIAAILGGSYSRNTLSSSSSNSVITSNHTPSNCTDRISGNGESCATARKISDSHTEARCIRKSVTHHVELGSGGEKSKTVRVS